MGIDIVHGRQQLFKDREVVRDDHARFLVCDDFLKRDIEEFREVFIMEILQCDADDLIVCDLFSV